MKKSICFSILLLLSFVAPALSATLEVGTGKTYSIIQDAIDAASSGDTISVYPGTYTENLTLTAGLTIQSTAGAATTIIDGDASGTVVTMASTCTLDGFTIQNGSDTLGKETFSLNDYRRHNVYGSHLLIQENNMKG